MNRAIRFCLLAIMFLGLALLTVRADNPKKPTKRTEVVIWNYETLIMKGALLSPEGWKKVAPLLDQSIAYPADSIIRILWTPRFIGEDWIKGNRAQVESKWIDYYGSLDSKLQYHPGDVCTLVIQYDLVFTNTYIKVGANGLQEEVKGATEWKLRWPNERSGTIEQVIAYLEKRRESTRDSIMRRNASRSISSLQNLLRRRGRGRGASAC